MDRYPAADDGHAFTPLEDSGLDPSLVEILKIRVSQINGCAFCLQFHLN